MVYRRLLSFLRPHSWRLAAAVACNVVVAALDVFNFTLLIPFLDQIFGETTSSGAITRLQARIVGPFLDASDPMGSLSRIFVVILVSVAVKNIFVWLSGHFASQLQEFVTRDLRNTLYSHLQRLPLSYFTRTRAGQILARVLTDTASAKQVLTESVTRSLQSAAVVVATIVALVAISWRLALLSLVIAPVLIALLQPVLRKLRKGHRRLGNQYGDMTSAVQEVVSGIRLVKSFGGERYEEERFVDASNRYAHGMMRVTRLSLLSQPIVETVGTAIAVAILAVGAQQVLVSQTMTGSNLITFMILVMRMLQPLKQLSQVPTTAQQSLAAAERIFDILDRPTEASSDHGRREVNAFTGDITFDGVSFTYGDEPVLRDISFTARRGDVVALVGPSGAGKSTLVDLIPRFYEPTDGRILLDGTETRELSLGSLRSLVGIVSQDTVLFNDTVRNNIAYAAPGRFTSEQVEAAARAANAHDFIVSLPEGYETVLGERGTRLSGGQRQRIAIARALLVDPPILVFDEATSALDTESERLVQEAIDRLLEGRTVFVIAHRLSTIAHASQILVLERGVMVEQGTHAELMARGGHYARLFAMQFADRGSSVGAPV